MVSPVRPRLRRPISGRNFTQATVQISGACSLCAEYVRAAEAGTIIGRKGLSKKQSTLATDKGRIVRHILPLLGSRKVRELKAPDIVRFIKDVSQGKTAVDIRTGPRGRAIVEGGKGTATRTAGLLGGILSYAVSEGIIEQNPVRGVKRPADEKRIIRLDVSDYKKLGEKLDTLMRQGTAWQALAAIKLITMTGCRKSEIETLKWADVDLDGQALRLSDTKTGRSIRPIGKPVVELLNSLPRSGTWVFPGQKQESHYGGLSKVWARNSPLDQITLHGLRHAFASVAGELGYSELVIGALLGHAAASVTSRYVHHIDATLIAAADKISRHISNMTETVND